MIPRNFEYVSPETLEQALNYLNEYGSDSKILAGGQSLVPLMKLRLASPKYVIDINHISDLDYIREDGGWLRIGALTKHHSIETSELLRRKAQIMSEAASLIGDPQVRNSGTIGGSLVHADPAADWGAVIIALGASLKMVSASGERIVNSDDFFVDSLTSAAKSNEILTEIRVPISNSSGGSYAKLERKSGDFATVGVAAQLSLNSSGVCEKVGIGLASVAATSIRAKKAEAVLKGNEPTRARIEEACESCVRGFKADRRSAERLGRVQEGDGSSVHGARSKSCARQGKENGVNEDGKGCQIEARPRQGERQGVRGCHRVEDAPRALYQRAPRDDRHPRRVRYVELRRMHSDIQRKICKVLHDVRGAGGWRGNFDDRRSRKRRQASPNPGRVLEQPRATVRFLHAGVYHAGVLVFETKPQSD